MFRGHGRLDRTNWKNRLDPLDILRCGYLYILPRNSDAFPSAREELEGLEVIQKFIAVTESKPHFAFRRAQAIACAIEIASKHGNYDLAFTLAKNISKAPNYIKTGYACMFASCRHFIGTYVEAFKDGSAHKHHEDVVEIRKLLQIDDATARNAAHWIRDELKKRVKELHTTPLGGMSVRQLINELSRTARRSYPLGEGAMDLDPASIALLRDGASESSILEAEKRLDWKLPVNYKDIVRVSNGWSGMYGTLKAMLKQYMKCEMQAN